MFLSYQDLEIEPEKLPDDQLAELLTAACGRLPVALARGKDKKPQVLFAGKYNAMDAGRVFWLWAVGSGRCSQSVPQQASWDVIAKAMRARSASVLRDQGISCPASFAKQVSAIGKIVMAWSTQPDTGPLRWPREALWPCVLVHKCEYARVLRTMGRSLLEQVTRAPAEIYRDAVDAVMRELASSNRMGIKCHTLMVCEAAGSAVMGASRRRVRSKAAPALHFVAGQAEAAPDTGAENKIPEGKQQDAEERTGNAKRERKRTKEGMRDKNRRKAEGIEGSAAEESELSMMEQEEAEVGAPKSKNIGWARKEAAAEKRAQGKKHKKVFGRGTKADSKGEERRRGQTAIDQTKQAKKKEDQLAWLAKQGWDMPKSRL